MLLPIYTCIWGRRYVKTSYFTDLCNLKKKKIKSNIYIYFAFLHVFLMAYKLKKITRYNFLSSYYLAKSSYVGMVTKIGWTPYTMLWYIFCTTDILPSVGKYVIKRTTDNLTLIIQCRNLFLNHYHKKFFKINERSSSKSKKEVSQIKRRKLSKKN